MKVKTLKEREQITLDDILRELDIEMKSKPNQKKIHTNNKKLKILKI